MLVLCMGDRSDNAPLWQGGATTAQKAPTVAMSAAKSKYRAKPEGWDDLFGRTRAYHWFGADGRALCGKWANLSQNKLLEDDAVHPDHRCKLCARRHTRNQPQ